MSDHTTDAQGTAEGAAVAEIAGASEVRERSKSVSWAGETRFARAASSALLLCLLVLAVTLPFALISGSLERVALLLLVDLIAVIGLQIYTGNSGILSVGHMGFFAAGAYLSGILTMPVAQKALMLPHLPAFLAQAEMGLLGSLAVVAIFSAGLGFLTGLPVSRLRNTSAIIATFGFLVIVNNCLIGASNITNGNKAFYGVPQLADLPIAYVLVFVTIVAALFFKESKYGLQLRAFQDEEVAASAAGVNSTRRLLQSWTVSAVFTGIAGAMFAHVIGAFLPRDFYIAPTFALVAMLVLGGRRSVSGAVIGAVIVTFLVEIVGPIESGLSIGDFKLPPIWGMTQIVLSGTILLVMYLRPAGIMGGRELALPSLANWIVRLGRGTSAVLTAEPSSPEAAMTLSTQGLGIRFGGLRALSNVSISVRSGRIVGLIGPNGAGKTTLINNLTGIHKPTEGSVQLGDVAIVGWKPEVISLSGLARTFQNIRLFKEMTVLENVVVAASAKGHPAVGIEDYARQLLSYFGMLGDADRKAATLSYGAQRKLEIARALALKPRFLLLDEPAAGMNRTETEALIEAIRAIRDRFDLGILVVEHDLHLIMRLCDDVFVLNKGELIASGSTQEVQNDPVVIEAYLGTKDFMVKKASAAN